MNDVFISYEHESKSIADNICAVLERNRIRCWYAPRDVIGDYATSIVEAITNSKIFVLVLNENSSNSRHVLNEVEIAYKIENTLTIIPFKVDNNTLSMAMEYYVKRLHWIDATNRSLDIAIEDLTRKVASILQIDIEKKAEPTGTTRVQNKYFSNSDIKEKKRLATQLKLLKDFDQPVYDRLVEGKQDLAVLDVGSNNGNLIMDRLGIKPEVKKILGLEYDADAVKIANEKHGTPDIKFYQCDLESADAESTLQSCMEEAGIDSFDIINLSMILLHLKNPYKVIRLLRPYLSDDGMIMVRDIDDGINFADPDPDGDFERVYRICRENETSGFRCGGRQIYSLLKKCGMKNVRLEKSGLNTIGMEFSEKQALFDTYFSFIMEDLEIMLDRYPNDERVCDDYNWYAEMYDVLEERFHSDEFIFSLGFMIYTAE